MTLVIVAHPDDESLFMGGTIAALRRAGERVVVVALADGVGSRFEWYQVLGFLKARRRRIEAFLRACQALDVEGRLFRLFSDQRADELSQLDLNQAMECLIATYHPDTVYTHWVGDLNLDHRRVAEAVIVATRPHATRYVKKVYGMAPEWPALAMLPWAPTDKRNLTEKDRAVKLQAVFQYHAAGELRAYPHPRSYRATQLANEQFVEIR